MLVLYLVFVLVLQRYFTVHTLQKPDTEARPPLEDVGFNTVPYLRSRTYSHLIDLTLYGALVFVLICSNRNQLKLFLTSALYIFLIRFVCLYVTRIPHTGSECKKSTKSVVQSNECNTDYIFSGHTSMLLLSLLHLREIYPGYTVPFAALFTTFVYLIVATRAHYTVDVVLAIVITYCVYVIVGIRHTVN